MPVLLRRSLLGFTLIELLVVLAIVALLATLALPRYVQNVELGKEVVLADNLRRLRDSIDQFYGDHGRYPDSLQELVDRHYLRALPVDPVTGTSDGWIIEAPPADFGGQVYDVRSSAPGQTRDGRPFGEL